MAHAAEWRRQTAGSADMSWQPSACEAGAIRRPSPTGSVFTCVARPRVLTLGSAFLRRPGPCRALRQAEFAQDVGTMFAQSRREAARRALAVEFHRYAGQADLAD